MAARCCVLVVVARARCELCDKGSAAEQEKQEKVLPMFLLSCLDVCQFSTSAASACRYQTYTQTLALWRQNVLCDAMSALDDCDDAEWSYGDSEECQGRC